MAPWSEQIARRYAIRLPDDVVDLIDSGHWGDEPWDGSFNQVLEPEAVCDGHAIWGGAMLPDTLPIIDNGCGDALAHLLRTARTAGSSALAALTERHLAQCDR